MASAALAKRKTPVLRIIAFCVVFAALFVQASYLFRPGSIDRSIFSSYYAQPKNSLDAVYIGGSACFVYWAPMVAWKEYGIASHNLGSNTMPADALKYCLEEALKTQSPKVVLIDARPFQYRDSQPPTEVALRNATDSMPYSANRFALVQNVASNALKANSVEYHLDLGKYHANWKSLSYSSFSLLDNRALMESKGFYFVPKTQPQKLVDLSTVTEKTPVSAETDAILVDLLEYCRKNNLKVLFVVNSYVEQPEHRRIYNYVKDVITAHGFDYLNANDYNTAIGLDASKDLYNPDHVNIFGAEKYTHFLSDYIAKKYSLPDRRGDPAYTGWENDCTVWDKLVKKKATIEKPPAEQKK